MLPFDYQSHSLTLTAYPYVFEKADRPAVGPLFYLGYRWFTNGSGAGNEYTYWQHNEHKSLLEGCRTFDVELNFEYDSF